MCKKQDMKNARKFSEKANTDPFSWFQISSTIAVAGQSKAIQNLRQGKKVYRVTSNVQFYRHTCYIQEYVIESRVYTSSIGLFVKVRRPDSQYIESISLRDANFSTEQNTYNEHKLFTSRKKAVRYLEQQKRKYS